MSNQTKKTIKKTSLFSIIFSLTICVVIVVFSFFNISLFPPKVDIQEVKAAGETVIYRSVGPSAVGSLAVGTSNSVSFSGSIATFTVALSDNIGVGDAIQYDSTGADGVDSIAFIHGRTSSTVYTIRDVAGGIVGNLAGDTDWSIFRAYISLANAESGIENTGIDDIVENFDTWSDGKDISSAGSNEQWNIACYANGSTADVVAAISGWTTDADSYIRIYTPTESSEIGVSQRHNGVWDTGKYWLHNNDSATQAIQVRDNHVRISGIQIQATGTETNSRYGIRIDTIAVGGAEIYLDNLIIKGIFSGTGEGYGIRNSSVNPSNVYIYNNLIYDFVSGADTGFIGIHTHSGTNTYIYNNTIQNCYYGILRNGTTAFVKNNITQDCIDGFSGIFDTISDYNISNTSQADADSANDTFDGYKTVTFEDSGSDDFHLAFNDATATDNATSSVDSLFTDDIDGETRIGTWDIGADEYITNAITISTLATSTVTTTGFNASINFTGDYNSNAVTTLYYCDDTDLSGCDPETVGTPAVMSRGSGVYTITISGLSENTPAHEYNLRVITTDTDGVTGSPLNTTVTLETPDVTAPATISDLDFPYSTSETIKLTWTAPGDDNATGTATTYDVRYSTTAIANDTDFNNATEATGEPSPSVVGSSESFILTGLTPETDYYFAIKTSDEIPNISGLSNVVNETTPVVAIVNVGSCEYVDVSTAIDIASSGDTVNVPAGNCTWASHLSITKGIQLIGIGMDNLKITSNYSSVDTTGKNPLNYLIDFSPDATSRSNDTPFRISGFTFEMDAKCRWLLLRNEASSPIVPITNVRIDNNVIQDLTPYLSETNWNKKAILFVGSVYGVISNNTFNNISTIEANGLQDITWDNLHYDEGTNYVMFVEDNIINIDGAHYIVAASGYGGRYVIRYNTINYTGGGSIQWLDMHGNQVSGVYSTMASEIYGNKIIEDMTANSFTGQDQRGGKSMNFWNKVTTDATIVKQKVREEYGDCMSPTTNSQSQHVSDSYYWNNVEWDNPISSLIQTLIDPTTQNCCSNTVSWQANTTYPYQYCTSFNGTDCYGQRNTSGCTSGAIEPTWLTDCAMFGSPLQADGDCQWVNMGDYSGPVIVENREFWNHNELYNGTTQIGIYCGSSLPANCTVGDGAWITSLSCGSINDENIGANPTTPISGTLYKCTSTNIWESYYTPYHYPHPLRDTGASPTFTINTGTETGPVSTDTINITATDDNGLDTSSLEYGYSIDNTCNASDTYGNSFTNSTDFTISTSHTEYLCVKATDTADNTGYQLVGQLNIETNAPTRSASSPSGTLVSGTTNTTISLTTNENATCKYGTTADTAYASIANTFTTTGGTIHSQTVTGLSNGNDYNYYARCIDTATNANVDDYAISFLVDFASTSGGGLSPLTFNPPTPPTPTTDNPKGGFKVVINNNNEKTNNSIVTLNFYAGSDTTNMAISNNEDFENAGIVPYQETIEWDLNNTQTVYAKFYTKYGVASEVVSAKIIYQSNENNKIFNPKTFAYNKQRLSSPAKERNFAKELKQKLEEYYGKSKIPVHKKHWHTIVNAYIYGNYPILSITQAIKFGGKTVHPEIPFSAWQKAKDYIEWIRR